MKNPLENSSLEEVTLMADLTVLLLRTVEDLTAECMVHQHVLFSMVAACVAYADANKGCCLQEGAEVLITECLSFCASRAGVVKA